MAQFTKLQEHEIQGIATKYALNLIDFDPIDQGFANTNYLINTKQGKYIFTVFEIDPTRVSRMSKLLVLLEKYDFPAPRLKSMRNGGVLTNYQEKPVLIKPYITGKVIDALDSEKIGQVGTALAKLHEVPAPDFLPSAHTYVEQTYPEVMEQEIDQEYKKWVENKHSLIIRKIPLGLPIGLVHGDIFSDNVLFEDEKFKALIDFEDASRIYKVFDLGMAIVGLCTEETEIVIEKAKALVKGYQEIRLLEELEIDCLQIFIEWAAVLTSTWRFWKYNINMPDIENASKHLQMVNIAENANAIPREEFINALF